MRLIIFVKIPGRVEPIPLDIIDDRPSQAVLDDILVIAKLSAKNGHNTNYYLSRNGTKLDPGLELSKNGVNNGALLDLVNSDEQIAPVSKNEFKEIAFQEKPSETPEEHKSNKKAKDRKSVV